MVGEFSGHGQGPCAWDGAASQWRLAFRQEFINIFITAVIIIMVTALISVQPPVIPPTPPRCSDPNEYSSNRPRLHIVKVTADSVPEAVVRAWREGRHAH